MMSKKIFYDFQHFTGTDETVESKIKMEWSCKESNVKLKVFRGNNWVYEAATCRHELVKYDQSITFYSTGVLPQMV